MLWHSPTRSSFVLKQAVQGGQRTYKEAVGVCSGYMIPVSITSYFLSECADTILSPE